MEQNDTVKFHFSSIPENMDGILKSETDCYPDFKVTEGQPTSRHQSFVEYLFRRYHKRLTRFVIDRVGNPSLADEIVQEAYIRVLQAEQLDNIESRARKYLFTVALNLVRDQHRHDHARGKGEYIFLDDACLSDFSDIEQTIEWNIDLQKIKQCLLELTPRCRKVFILYVFEQLSSAEIAGALRVSRKTIGRDLSIAFEFCRSRLRD